MGTDEPVDIVCARIAQRVFDYWKADKEYFDAIVRLENGGGKPEEQQGIIDEVSELAEEVGRANTELLRYAGEIYGS